MAISDHRLGRWLLASLRSGLVAIDEGGAITALNAAAQRILGGPEGAPEAWLGRDFRDALGAWPQVVDLLDDARSGREHPARAELLLDPSPGRAEGTLGFTVAPVRDDAGALRGAAIQFRDLSDFERLDEQQRLRERLAALGQMAAGLAHELRNPLASMEVLAGLLERRLAPDGEERQLLRELVGQLRAVTRSLDGTLAFVRPTPGRPQEIDPVSLLEECLDRACTRVHFPGKVERDYEEALPPLVADPEQLRAVFTDLLVNALEAMDDADSDGARAPRLDLCLRRELRAPLAPEPRRATDAAGAELVFSIGDSGPGVPRELRDRIFYPFFTTKAGGSGVGLANAQKVVTGHGGLIELAEAVGGGAVFRVRLPVAGRCR